MPRTTTTCLALSLAFGAASFASDDQPSREQLQQKLETLKSRVAELEQQQSRGPDPQEVARVIDEMVADAERRSQLLFADESITGGFNLETTKFYLKSADGNYLLTTGFYIQVRNTTNIDTADDETNNGWEIRRLRLNFEGNAFSPDLQYKFSWEGGGTGGNPVLKDAWGRYKLAKNLSFQFGQYKDPWNHEQNVGAQNGLAVERSLVDALIAGGQTDRIQGAMLVYDDKQHWRGQLLFDDGYNSDNTSFNQGGGTNFIGVIPTDFGFTGRLEYFANGASRKQYDSLTGYGNTEDLLVFGGGLSFSQGGDSNVLFQTIDAQYENSDGLLLYGALVGLYREIGAGEPVDPGSFYDWGFLVQGGYLFTKKLEGFARYDLIRFDGESNVLGQDTYQEIAVGINYFFKGNHVRLAMDFVWLPDGSPINVLGSGFVQGDDDQFVIRAQFQLYL